MKRTFAWGMLLGTIIGALVVGLIYLPHARRNRHFLQREGTAMKPVRIATLSMLNSAFAHRLVKQFKEVLAEKTALLDAQVDSYYADNRLDMTAVANEMVDKNYDLIYTLGATASKTAQAVTAKRNVTTPVVFAWVVDPARLELVQNEERPGGHLTGITLDNNTKEMLADFATLLKPSMKSVLIPWDRIGNGGLLEHDVAALAEKLSARGIKVRSLPVKTRSDVLTLSASLIHEVDSVIVPEGSILVTESIEGLIKLCTQHHVTLIANDLAAVAQGAAIGWGPSPRAVAEASFDFVQKILVDGISPSIIPVNRMRDSYHVAVNAAAAAAQDLTLSPAQLFLLNRGSVQSAVTAS